MSAVEQQPEQEPSIFRGTGFACTEIVLSLQELTAIVGNLRKANSSGSAVDQKLAAEAVSRHARQIQTMADTISRVTVNHLNRSARVRP